MPRGTLKLHSRPITIKFFEKNPDLSRPSFFLQAVKLTIQLQNPNRCSSLLHPPTTTSVLHVDAETTVNNAGVKIFYRMYGHGPTKDLHIVGTGEGVEVCAFDNRGMGRSSVPTHKSEYTTTIMAKDSVSLLDHLEWERAHIIGHSMDPFRVQVAVHKVTKWLLWRVMEQRLSMALYVAKKRAKDKRVMEHN
ncbi:unnamed protein product [Microthlaspi erraticum]|uniref:AB hydrolase-1 domain-containing protein n=1 Tax=Microthlaspi erraticum TaxID=1685480 RepID=A0A6D2L403_9BRAS|nr:unnamed protein product [Microthlaspi erraticum]CAA7056051.1 unnamed protein product [Microthlaspi erraticum]